MFSLNIALMLSLMVKLYANIVIINDKNNDNLTKKSLEIEYLNGQEQYLNLSFDSREIKVTGYKIIINPTTMALK